MPHPAEKTAEQFILHQKYLTLNERERLIRDLLDIIRYQDSELTDIYQVLDSGSQNTGPGLSIRKILLHRAKRRLSQWRKKCQFFM